MKDDLIRFVENMDRCWLERRFDDLAEYLAPDVVVVAPKGAARLEGADLAIASYREFIERSNVRSFRAFDHSITCRGTTGVVEYRWQMNWESGETEHAEEGREILVLSRQNRKWRVIWRTQIPA